MFGAGGGGGRLWVVALSLAAYGSVIVLFRQTAFRPVYTGLTVPGTIGLTLYYFPAFGFGVAAADLLLARRRAGPPLPPYAMTGLALVALAAAKVSGAGDFGWAIAFTILIFAVCQPGPLGALARLPVAQFFGRISYSLYLIHVPILLTIVYGLYPRHSPLVGAIAGPVVATGAAMLMFRYIELPGIAVGRWLAGRMRSSQMTGAPSRSTT